MLLNPEESERWYQMLKEYGVSAGRGEKKAVRNWLLYLDIALAESYFEKGMDGYEVNQLANRGWMQAQAGGKLELCFVAVGILVNTNILNGNLAEARELLGNFKDKVQRKEMRKLIPNNEAMECRFALYGGEKAQIDGWMEATILQAVVLYHLGKAEWKTYFQNALSQAEEYHFVRIFSKEGTVVLELLKKQNWNIKTPQFFDEVVSETERMAKAYPFYFKRYVGNEEYFSENAIEILQLQAQGMSYAQIADALQIKETTVKYHCMQNYKKMEVSGKAAAVMEARKRKLI